ncbi:hypothetical protein SAMN05443247_08504 [Bradyrhizobium erythrophlei]|jgi:hypothetical protein|nr:hypothetical protein SAMN05443247_08504 [Bradyrhizobium erythrophlei]
MAHRSFGGSAKDNGGEDEDPGRSEARSTFDRLLREYFELFDGEFPATSEETRSSDPPSDARNKEPVSTRDAEGKSRCVSRRSTAGLVC